jgi:hypothetical protein
MPKMKEGKIAENGKYRLHKNAENGKYNLL